MNKLILIGNGFDLAHLYKTSYNHFIENYWNNISKVLNKVGNVFCNELIIEKKYSTIDANYYDLSKYAFLKNSLRKSNIDIIFKNKFLENISNTHNLNNWVDIENAYYLNLLELLKTKEFNGITKINNDFQVIINLFTEYLQNEFKDSLLDHISDDVKNNFFDRIANNLFAKVKKTEISYQEFQNFDIENILIVNFNYTYTDKIYTENNSYKEMHKTIDVIRIHGELDSSKNNKIIFGFGDELDENYKTIEKLNDNRYFDYIKSFKYLESDNYSKLLKFLEMEKFQTIIMGHSCGLSDRTLLNTIFEHKNCISIKPYYYKKNKSDNYTEIVKNISRSFNNKIKMRAKVVNKNYCEPMSNFR